MSLSEDTLRITKEMRDAYDSRVAAVGAMREAATQQLAELHVEHREMAAAQRAELQQFAETLRQTVATLIHDLDVERATLNAEQQRRLDAFTHAMRQDMATFLDERATERRAANASQRQSLDSFMSALRKRTSSFLADVHAARMAVHADQSSAQQAWQQFTTEMQSRRVGHPRPAALTEQRGNQTTKLRTPRGGKRQPKPSEE
ncbi:hypothetical protein EKD04_012420 [Chloroflexales bacterium ZM16-3]|nr:hypothetical protein [Chloroflexales bacterium ZM16-3]